MKEFKAEIAKPNPKSTINSYRSFGYNLSTAISDIIDNSISANANEIRLEYKWNGQDSYISICDNGIGMNKASFNFTFIFCRLLQLQFISPQIGQGSFVGFSQMQGVCPQTLPGCGGGFGPV